jgi:hypothetical protein
MHSAFAAIMAEFAITVVHPAQHRPFTPMHTAAGNTLERILREKGENHLRDVLTALTESENNRNMLIAPVIKAVSRIMAANAGWYNRDATKFLEVMDKADLAAMYEAAKSSKQVVSAQDAIATMLLAKFSETFRPIEQGRLI